MTRPQGRRTEGVGTGVGGLEAVIYDLAHQALRDQAETVEGLRARTGPLIAAATGVAGLFANTAIGDANGWRLVGAVAGLAVGGISIVAALNVVRSRRFRFSIDSQSLYESAIPDRADPEVYLARLAAVLRDAREENDPDIEVLRRSFTIALVTFAAEVLSLFVALLVA